MQKRSVGLLVPIYVAAILSGVTLSWIGILVVAAIYLVCFLERIRKNPFFAPMSTWQINYAVALFLASLLMFLACFLSHRYGMGNTSQLLSTLFCANEHIPHQGDFCTKRQGFFPRQIAEDGLKWPHYGNTQL